MYPTLNKLLRKAQTPRLKRSGCNKFIYVGQNERPVRALFYRPKELGGLQLICGSTKARSFTVKHMLRQQEDLDGGMEGTIYGRKKYLDRILSSGVNINNIKEIYTFLLQDRIGTD